MKFHIKKVGALLLCGVLCATMVQPMVAKAAGSNPKVSLTTNVSGNISQNYIIEPNGSNISLDDLSLRYYYEKTGSKSQSFACDSAGLNMNVAPYYQDISKDVKGTFKSNYLEITFSGAHVISNGRLNLGIRFNQTDWSSYTDFKEVRLDVIYNGTVVDSIVYDKNASTDPVNPSNPSNPTDPVNPSNPSNPTDPVNPSNPSQEINGCVLPKCDVDKDGPFAVTVEYNAGPSGKGILVRPTNLCTNGVAKHPIFIWNPGGGDQPSLYLSKMKRWASQGFVVYSEESQWSGEQCNKALDWICNQNSNPRSSLYNKLDLDRIAAGGFSLGSIGAYNVASDPRIKTTIHCDGGSFDGKGYLNWNKPTCVMNGLNDGGLAVNNTNRDYANATVPIWYGGIVGGGHGSTVWDGGDAITGWLRWQLCGDDLSSMFLTPGGRFNTGIFKSQWKNW